MSDAQKQLYQQRSDQARQQYEIDVRAYKEQNAKAKPDEAGEKAEKVVG